jgi:seryl-tRNA synthetase
MLDIKFIRDNSEIIKLAATKKKLKFDVDELIKIDTERVDIMKRAEDLRAKQNAAGESMQRVVGAEREQLLNSLKTVKEDLKKVEDELEPVMKKWRELMLQVPNIPDMSVPDGQSDEDNQEIRKVGEPRNFDFTPLDHIQIMEQNDMVDFERGTKTSGFRGYFLKNDGALLEMAVWQYVMQKWSKKDFTPMIVPSMVKRETLLGSGYLPQGEDDLYKDGDDYLSGTGEVATMYYHSGEVMDKSELPKKFLAFSTCFRKEAGSHGKDVKGLVRVHEFYKLEQVILCEASHETSVIHHEELLRNAEEMMEELGIPYHTVVNCGADLGLGQVKKYDIEAWMPSQNKYRETHSCSYFHDFQTRRLNIRYKDADGKVRFAHSLNNTAAATPRLITAIIENYQNADGTVTVPEVLIPYVGKTILGKSKVA